MARTKKVKEEETEEGKEGVDFFSKLAKNVGGTLLDDFNCAGFIDTGCLAINFILSGRFVGGGVPKQSILEVCGQNASGKSLLGTNILKGCQKQGGVPVFHDAEQAISKDFAIKASHVDPSKLIVTSSETLQGSFNKIYKVIRQAREVIPMEKPIVIIYDSIASSPVDREFCETTVDMENTSLAKIKELGGGNEKPGERAKEVSSQARKLTALLRPTNTCVVFINQFRKTFGGGPYGPDMVTTSGMALGYYSGSRIQMSSSKQLKDKNGFPFGVNCNIKNLKSRFTSPYKVCRNVKIYFEKGIDPFGGLCDLLLQSKRIERTSPGIFKLDESFTDGKEVKFKSSVESNVVPVEILLEYPKLVDAESADDINYYIEMFGDAMNAADEISSETDFEESEE